jgi:hypothetical protein
VILKNAIFLTLIPQKRKISSPENGIVRYHILNRKSSKNDEDGKTKN